MNCKLTLTWIFICILLSGCSFNSLNNPIKTRIVGDIAIASMEATNRAIIVSQGRPNEPYQFCAEPPPDAVADLANSISTALQAETNTGSKNIGLALTAANNLVRSTEEIYSRSHAVQLFRDASFSLCQAYLIGASRDSTSPEIKKIHEQVEELQVELSEIEIEESKLFSEQQELERRIEFEYGPLFPTTYDEQQIIYEADSKYRELRRQQEPISLENNRLDNLIKNLQKKQIELSQRSANYLVSFENLLTLTTEVLSKEVVAIYEAELVEAKIRAELLSPKTDVVDLLKSVSDMSADQAESLIELIKKLPKSDTVVCNEGEEQDESGACVDDDSVKDGQGAQLGTGEEESDEEEIEAEEGDAQEVAPTEESCKANNLEFDVDKNECVEATN